MSILGINDDVYKEYLDKIDESTKSLDDFIVIECHISHPGSFFLCLFYIQLFKKIKICL